MQRYADNPELWRERAEEVRVQAEQMNGEEARRVMLTIAENYERMAESAEKRLAQQRRSFA